MRKFFFGVLFLALFSPKFHLHVRWVLRKNLGLEDTRYDGFAKRTNCYPTSPENPLGRLQRISPLTAFPRLQKRPGGIHQRLSAFSKMRSTVEMQNYRSVLPHRSWITGCRKIPDSCRFSMFPKTIPPLSSRRSLRWFKRSSVDVRLQVDALNVYPYFQVASFARTAVGFTAEKSGTPVPHTNPGAGIAIINS